jgi:calcineurin-like phosphoesterase family protein
VIHLGDVAWGFLAKDGVLLDLMNSLPGQHKILIKGNHDSHGYEHYYKNGFCSVVTGLMLSGIYLTHEPQEIIPKDCMLNVHGHLHNNVPQDFRAFPHCKLYALEYENYEPRQFEKFCRPNSKEK